MEVEEDEGEGEEEEEEDEDMDEEDGDMDEEDEEDEEVMEDADEETPPQSHGERIVREALMAQVSGDVIGALRRYLFGFKIQPSLTDMIREEFVCCLYESSSHMDTPEQREQLLPLLRVSVSMFPQEPEAMAALATLNFRMGLLQDSMKTWKKLLAVNPMSLLALESHDNLCSQLVDRWHFRMLNDKVRNTCYQEAIQRAFNKVGSSAWVLDMGCGSGLLSMMAAKAGAAHVVACDLSEAMCSVTQQALGTNGVSAGTVQVAHCHSKELHVIDEAGVEGGKHGIERRVDVLVTETADCGLLGERMLTSMQKARDSLVTASGLMIPRHATVHVMLLASPYLRSMAVVNKDALCGFNLPDSINLSPTDPYLCEYLRECRYAELSKGTEALHVPFPGVTGLLPSVKGLAVTATACGHVDAIAMWWDLWLDEETCFTTSPFKYQEGAVVRVASAWEQAVYVPARTLMVAVGDVVQLDVECSPKCLFVSLSGQQPGPPDSRQCVQMADRDISVLNDVERNSAYKSAIKAALRSVNECKSRACEERERKRMPRVLDMTHGWSLTPLMAVQCGLVEVTVCDPPCDEAAYTQLLECNNAQAVVRLLPAELSSAPMEGRLAALLSAQDCRDGDDDQVASAHTTQGSTSVKQRAGPGGGKMGIRGGASTAVGASTAAVRKQGGLASFRWTAPPKKSEKTDKSEKATEEDETKSRGVREVPVGARMSAAAHDSLFDVLVVDPVEPGGLLRQNMLGHMRFAARYLLKPGGVCVPSRMDLECMCIQSSEIMLDNKIDSSAQCGFKVEALNEFGVRTLMSLNLDTASFQSLTAPFQGMTFDILDLEEEYAVSTTVKVSARGCLQAIVYWFRLEFEPGHELRTYAPGLQGEGSGRLHGTQEGPHAQDSAPRHWRQAAWVLPRAMEVEVGDVLGVEARCSASYIAFNVVKAT